jgi:Nif-specific regulatory protein
MLDEIGEMSPTIQAKFLRVLEGHPYERVGGSEPLKVDVRVIAATNRDLEKDVTEGRFRRDLYFRLHVLEIIVPALRKRPDDIPELARYFFQKYNLETGRKLRGFTPRAMEHMVRYRWPGNVRELKNLVERLMILCAADEIRREDLPAEIRDGGVAAAPPADAPLRDAREDFERRYILASLKSHRGNVTRTAEALGVERSNLYRKLKSYGIEVERE